MMNFKQWLILSETITVKDQEFRDPLYALKHIQKTHPNPENLVVTFTAIDKVGINPKSTYDTPFGIYFYPLDYVIEKKMNVEFAGDQPYINVCEFVRPDKILHMTDDVNNQKGLELLNVFSQEEVELSRRKFTSNMIINQLRSNYSELWLVTREMAKKRAITTSDSLDVYYGAEEKTNEAVLWNANLRKCGIDGFLDHGTGTIHRNEPTQGVVFTGTALRRILVIPQILRKPLPDINKIPLNQLENLLKNRNLFNNDIDKFLNDAENKDEIARIIIQYKPELSNDDIFTLLYYAENKDEIARILGSDNINKLSDDDIYSLLRLAENKDEIARIILGSDNINKLTYGSVYLLLKDASDIEEMARILGQKNIDKLSGDTVLGLLRYASNKKKMAEILGSDNINKLSDENVFNLLHDAFDKDEKKQILRKYYTGTNPEVISLLNQ